MARKIRGQPRILVVDDEPDLLELLELTLSRMGLDTVCAQSVGEAVRLLDKEPFDLCLTDMRLPDGEGLRVVEHITQKGLDVPVAVITAFGSAENAVAALKAGAFYASTGPEFRSIEIDDKGRLRIECSPVEHIFVTARGSQEASAHGRDITEAAFDLDRIWRPVVGAPLGGFDSPFCRVTIRDAEGGRAWSNPIWLGGLRDGLWTTARAMS